MIISTALMIWKGLMVVTGSESPIVKGETADLKDPGSVEIQYKIFEIFKIQLKS